MIGLFYRRKLRKLRERREAALLAHADALARRDTRAQHNTGDRLRRITLDLMRAENAAPSR